MQQQQSSNGSRSSNNNAGKIARALKPLLLAGRGGGVAIDVNATLTVRSAAALWRCLALPLSLFAAFFICMRLNARRSLILWSHTDTRTRTRKQSERIGRALWAQLSLCLFPLSMLCAFVCRLSAAKRCGLTGTKHTLCHSHTLTLLRTPCLSLSLKQNAANSCLQLFSYWTV